MNVGLLDDHTTIGLEASSPSIDSKPLPSSFSSKNDNKPTIVHQPPSYLHDYHCYSTIVSLHEPSSYIETSVNPFYQQAMQEELYVLTKTHT